MEKVYHIYAKNKCILHSIKEEDFEVAWNTLKKMIDIVKTEYHIEDLSFEELYINKDITLSSSH